MSRSGFLAASTLACASVLSPEEREAGWCIGVKVGGGSVSPLRSTVVWAPKEVVQAVATGLGCLRFWRAASNLIDSARISMALNAAAAPIPKSLH